jgi:hypothetical protein
MRLNALEGWVLPGMGETTGAKCKRFPHDQTVGIWQEMCGANSGSKAPSNAKAQQQIRCRQTFKLGSMAHACNPRYSGGRNQEECGLKPARVNRS